ncbi:hypothetical protein [Dictyobacter aurantiacus]|uniref:Uncharacterized protein n=1 Tax=Dictyobacter aurantiacus TaxID=1936993 RepID=A0A401ZEC1_9CHLR|nr:hypothetical protein [Dictyobacter aurantiacus]GCE05186.1 hypothetical protein KDAU_25150 [Dictyobacter aurantiacus]
MPSSESSQISTGLTAYFAIVGIIGLISIIFAIIIWWKIFSKAGYSGAMSLLMFIPIANLVVLCILAFGEWPVLQELNMLRQQVRSMPQQYSSNPQGPQFAPGQNFQSGPQYPRY